MKSPYTKKILSIILLSVSILIGAYYVTYRSPEMAHKKIVAILCPIDLARVDRICEGVEEALAHSSYAHRSVVRTFGFDVFDKIRTLATVETIFEQKPTVIIAIGGTAARALKETMAKRSISIPVVFAGVNVAIEWGFIESYERPEGNMTGVDAIGEVGVNMQARLALITKPSIKKVLIPFIRPSDPTDTRAESIACAMKEYLEQKGVGVTLVGLADCSMLDKVASVLPGHDMLCSLEMDAMGQLNSGFSKLCSKMGVTFFCGGLDGITLGAAISFGLDPKPIGHHLFAMAADIMFEGKHPATMPIDVMTVHRELYINVASGLKQGYRPNLAHIVRELAADPETAPLVERLHIVQTPT